MTDSSFLFGMLGLYCILIVFKNKVFRTIGKYMLLFSLATRGMYNFIPSNLFLLVYFVNILHKIMLSNFILLNPASEIDII